MDTSMANITMIPMTSAEFEWIATHTGLIKIEAFKPAIGVLFAFAIVCFIGRISIRIATRRRLYLDDYFLILAVITLCASTVLIYHYCFLWFLMNAAQQRPELVMTTAFLPYMQPLFDSAKFRNATATMMWTTVFAVKFCFFAFFKPLIAQLRSLTIYYWFSVAFTILAYGVCFSEAFVFDKYQARDFALDSWYKLSLSFTIVITLVDVFSDMMIMSIPILLLRQVRLKTSSKLSVGFFLCLSVFMAICCIIRASGYIHKGSRIPDTIWRVFWQQVEGCIAVMMASITIFRTLFTGGQQHQNQIPNEQQSQRPSYFSRLLASFLMRRSKASTRDSSGEEGKKDIDGDYIELPAMPSATFTGVRSFIRRNHRHGPATTIAESEIDPMEADYHANIRR